jgi:ketosteroid isomerase-like protein
MSDWDDLTARLDEALRRFVDGDPEPYKSLWSRRDDVTIFGAWGAWEQGWAAVGPRLDWAASRFAHGRIDRHNLFRAADQDIAFSVDIEHIGARIDGASQARETPLRVTHLCRREDGQWRIVHRHADFLQSRQEAD